MSFYHFNKDDITHFTQQIAFIIPQTIFPSGKMANEMSCFNTLAEILHCKCSSTAFIQTINQAHFWGGGKQALEITLCDG